eukprot:366278-Chlamydomonas_euryale.AAC.8
MLQAASLPPTAPPKPVLSSPVSTDPSPCLPAVSPHAGGAVAAVTAVCPPDLVEPPDCACFCTVGYQCMTEFWGSGLTHAELARFSVAGDATARSGCANSSSARLQSSVRSPYPGSLHPAPAEAKLGFLSCPSKAVIQAVPFWLAYAPSRNVLGSLEKDLK